MQNFLLFLIVFDESIVALVYLYFVFDYISLIILSGVLPKWIKVSIYANLMNQFYIWSLYPPTFHHKYVIISFPHD